MKKFVFCMVVILILAMVMPTTGCPEQLTLTAQEYNQRGMSLANQGKNEDAVKDYTRAIKLDANDPQFYVNRGIAYLNMQEFDLAISDFDKAIELSKDTELTEYVKLMLESITETSPPPPDIIDETQEDTVSQTSDIAGSWHGTLEIVGRQMGNYDNYSKDWREYDAKGEFSFNILSDGTVSGSGTAQGSYSYRIHGAIGRVYEVTSEQFGNFATTYKVCGHVEWGEQGNRIIIQFLDIDPIESTKTNIKTHKNMSFSKYDSRYEDSFYIFSIVNWGGTSLDRSSSMAFEFRGGATCEGNYEWMGGLGRGNEGTVHWVVTIYKDG